VHPRSLPPFTVVRIPFLFEGSPKPVPKLFIILGHLNNSAFCLKPTSQTGFYDNNPDRRGGCVCYEALEVDFFSKRTIIDPDNQFEIPHLRLADLQEKGALEVVGKMPEDFGQRLKAVIANSETLDEKRKSWLRAVLPGY